MNVLVIDGHPAPDRLGGHLLDTYVAALPPAARVARIAVRDLIFDPVLHDGYGKPQAWEPDLARTAEALLACDHLVIAFPLWWGAEPAPLKALLDRVLLPGFAFRYRSDSALWDRLLVGRSADLVVTTDTPPWYLRLVYGDPVMKRWRHQVLGFCGFKPIRVFRLGPTRRGQAAKRLAGWHSVLAGAAATAAALRRSAKAGRSLPFDAEAYRRALAQRQS